MEGCRLLAEARGLVEREEMREWARHARDKKKKKGDVGTEKEKEEEEERLANFFYAIHEFFVPTELPARYAIDFVPVSVVSVTTAVVVNFVAPTVPNPVVSSATSSDYSVVSSANFVNPAISSTNVVPVHPSSCIGTI